MIALLPGFRVTYSILTGLGVCVIYKKYLKGKL